MTETSEVVVRVNFRRQTQPRQYETAAAEMTVEQSFPATLSPSDIEGVAKQLAQLVKVGVYRELGLNFEQDEETRVIMEVFPGSDVVAQTTTAQVAPGPATSPAKPSAAPRGTGGARKAPAASTGASGDPWEDLAANPGDWYDNTENKTNPKAPDFRNKSGRFKTADGRFNLGLWLNNKPEDLVLPDEGYAS